MRIPEPLIKVCECGALIWDVQWPSQLPGYSVEVRCHQCWRDHSRQPPLWWLVRYVLRRAKRYKKVFGWKGMLGRLRPRDLLDYRPLHPRPQWAAMLDGTWTDPTAPTTVRGSTTGL